VEGSCENGNEPSGSLNCWEVLDYLHNWSPLKKSSTPRMKEYSASKAMEYIVCDTIEVMYAKFLLSEITTNSFPMKVRLCLRGYIRRKKPGCGLQLATKFQYPPCMWDIRSSLWWIWVTPCSLAERYQLFWRSMSTFLGYKYQAPWKIRLETQGRELEADQLENMNIWPRPFMAHLLLLARTKPNFPSLFLYIFTVGLEYLPPPQPCQS
jgi:hypothetical protein